MKESFLEFEKPIIQLEKKLQDLKEISQQEGVNLDQEIALLEKKVNQLIQETYEKISPWNKVQLARHPNRPHSRDYIDLLFENFKELAGDRSFGEDPAILGGVTHFQNQPLLVLANQKGRSTQQKIERHFGMAKPEGYRKAIRLMQLADRFQMPILTLIDTPGAHPAIDAEERGQSQAVAESIHTLFQISVPVIAIIIGEGGSGGALALGVGNHVAMQEFSIYSVISPESCASILWSDSSLAEKASDKLKMNPTDLFSFGMIDSIIAEPRGGAHRNWSEAAGLLKKHLETIFPTLLSRWKEHPENMRRDRFRRFRALGNQAILET